MENPTPQTPDEMTRECMGCIARVCEDMARCAMNVDKGALETHYNFLRVQMNRLDTIERAARLPREMM